MLDKSAIGKRITFFRKERGMTQRELADLLHISYQAVSKLESGKSLPTIELLYKISMLLDVTVDALLNEKEWQNRGISYMESGLDVQKLYTLKREIEKLTTADNCILSANIADACLFRIDTSQMKDPVYSCIHCVPGSKAKLAKEYRYNQEICADTAANGMNFILQHGMRPVLLKAMVLCGNYNQEQLYLMAQSFRRICDQNQVAFSGMEIAAQPVNYTPEEYTVSATVIGVQDRDKLLIGDRLREGDVLIGIKTEGIEGTSYPFVKIMLDRKPELYHAKIDENIFFLDELMRANTAYAREIMALQEAGYLHMALRNGHALLNRKTCEGGCSTITDLRAGHTLLNRKFWREIPDGIGACIDLSAVPVLPLYRFLYEQDMIGEEAFAYHFSMGIGMIVAVSEKYRKEAMDIIGQFSECWCIGRIEPDDGHEGEKVWSRGKISW